MITTQQAATKIIVSEDFTYVARSFQYAAAYRVVRIHAGEYPIEYVTIHYTKPYAPLHHDGGPYYATAKLTCETLETRHTLETSEHHFNTYQSRAVPGEIALGDFEGNAYVGKAFFA